MLLISSSDGGGGKTAYHDLHTNNKGYDLLSITFKTDLTLRYDLVYTNWGYFDIYLLVGAVVYWTVLCFAFLYS